MDYSTDLKEARFLRRLNRFAAEFEIHGKRVVAHVANSGRLGELLMPKTKSWLRPMPASHRKTAFDLTLMESPEGTLVSLDARLPNALFAEAFHNQKLKAFSEYDAIQSEVALGESRIDFRLTGPSGPAFVEVKSVTLVENEVARFPDAPTLRGVRHLNELIRAVQGGYSAAVVFVVQRDDARQFSPHHQADPLFSKTLAAASSQGVSVLAFACHISLDRAEIIRPLPVTLAS